MYDFVLHTFSAKCKGLIRYFICTSLGILDIQKFENYWFKRFLMEVPSATFTIILKQKLDL